MVKQNRPGVQDLSPLTGERHRHSGMLTGVYRPAGVFLLRRDLHVIKPNPRYCQFEWISPFVTVRQAAPYVLPIRAGCGLPKRSFRHPELDSSTTPQRHCLSHRPGRIPTISV
jgi:hypothetical protein